LDAETSESAPLVVVLMEDCPVDKIIYNKKLRFKDGVIEV
jgi:hypothetical protein